MAHNQDQRQRNTKLAT